MIVIVGLSHHTASIGVREQVALSDDAARKFVSRLRANADVGEVFVVSTCNRFEVVASALDDSDGAGVACAEACRAVIVEHSPSAATSLYSHHGLRAVRHLFRVAASLDSLVVGEAQILGQIKQGFEMARDAKAVGPTLHQLFARATRGAKRVRTETSVGEGQVSVPSIAVDLASQIFGDLSRRRAALIGLGEMGQSVARLLRDAGAELIVVGRDLDRIAPVAERFSGQARLMGDLSEVLAEVDVVVSSTNAPSFVVHSKDLELRRKKRKGGNLFFIDLAVPRDIELQIGKLDGVFLYDVDDLSQVAEQSTGSRQKAAQAAEVIVGEAVSDWERRESAEQVTPTIKALRAKMRMGLEAELARSLRGRLRNLGPEERAALTKMLDSGLNRILHDPTTRLREEASMKEGAAEVVSEVLNDLFDLGEVSSDELGVPGVRLPSSDSMRPRALSRRPSSGTELAGSVNRAKPSEVEPSSTEEDAAPSARTL